MVTILLFPRSNTPDQTNQLSTLTLNTDVLDERKDSGPPECVTYVLIEYVNSEGVFMMHCM